MPSDQTPRPREATRFLFNVLWSWVAVAFGLIAGIFLSPYVIHRLGAERYGIWALAFSFVDYFALVDLGFKSAVVKYVAQYRVTRELGEMEALVSTGLAYFTGAGAVVLAASLLLSQYVSRLFNVLPSEEGALRFLTITVGAGCALTAVSGVFTAVMEAHGRFDITSRILMIYNGVRAVGTFAVVYVGLELRSMGICILVAQVTAFLLTYASIRRLLPGLRFSVGLAQLASFRRMFSYGSRTLVANISLIVLNQDAPLLISHFLSTTFVGYWSFPFRLIAYPVELVGRLGMVTGSKAAELTAHNRMDTIARMAIVVNRYCLLLFLIIPVYLSIFGFQLLKVWLTPSFAGFSAPLLPVLGFGLVVAIAAQYNSTSILYGLGKHSSLAISVLVEAILSVACLWYVIPRYGLLGAACVYSGLMSVSRGLCVPYMVAYHLRIGFSAYLLGIYARPVAIMTPIAAAAWLINRALQAPANWTVVIGGGLLMSAAYYAAVFFYGLMPEHRAVMLSSVGDVFRNCAAWWNRRQEEGPPAL